MMSRFIYRNQHPEGNKANCHRDYCGYLREYVKCVHSFLAERQRSPTTLAEGERLSGGRVVGLFHFHSGFEFFPLIRCRVDVEIDAVSQ